MNTTETTMFSNENILITTNVITAGLALLSEIMAISKCKDNGIIDIILKSCKKTVTTMMDVEDENVV
jgi:NAD/NADP transhydrogenase beta subunit